jgi:lipoyl(octanoyl) transferase
MPACRWRDLGRVPYGEALALQKDAVRRRIAGETPDVLLFVEHPDVITLGKVARAEHVVAPRPGTEVVATDRGGDVTYHGPGQLVGYPILDLHGHRRDVKWYLERLEDVLVEAVGRFGIGARRSEGRTGAWAAGGKIAAIGVRVERWVTSHGFALNVSTDLAAFGQIIPCGLPDRRVTSVERETGRRVALAEARDAVVEAFGRVFGLEMIHEAQAPGGP